MYINIIDYRGDEQVANSLGETLFQYRTRYFVKQQEDFALWKKHGHKFVCFTQHPDDTHFDGFDEVIPIARGTCDQSRNAVLKHYANTDWKWMGMWDNDSTLYWDKMNTHLVPQELDNICALADEKNIAAWVPFNPQQSPYPDVNLDEWTFVPTIHLKGSMTFIHNEQQYYDDSFAWHGGDVRYAIQLTKKYKKCAILEQASLNELVRGKSTVFKINAYHEQYKNPGANANPYGLLKWDSTIARKERLKEHDKHLKATTGLTIGEWGHKQRCLWSPETKYFDLFEEI